MHEKCSRESWCTTLRIWKRPKDWLGKEFLEGADWLRKTKPLKYRHMYLGEMVGSGTQVFDNIVSRKITAKEIAGFDNIISGVDWGWYPDPWVFIRTYYHAATRTLYIFDELRGNKLENKETAQLIKKTHRIRRTDSRGSFGREILCGLSQLRPALLARAKRTGQS